MAGIEKTFMELLIANEKLEQSLSETTDITDVSQKDLIMQNLSLNPENPLEEITEDIGS